MPFVKKRCVLKCSGSAKRNLMNEHKMPKLPLNDPIKKEIEFEPVNIRIKSESTDDKPFNILPDQSIKSTIADHGHGMTRLQTVCSLKQDAESVKSENHEIHIEEMTLKIDSADESDWWQPSSENGRIESSDVGDPNFGLTLKNRIGSPENFEKEMHLLYTNTEIHNRHHDVNLEKESGNISEQTEGAEMNKKVKNRTRAMLLQKKREAERKRYSRMTAEEKAMQTQKKKVYNWRRYSQMSDEERSLELQRKREYSRNTYSQMSAEKKAMILHNKKQARKMRKHNSHPAGPFLG